MTLPTKKRAKVLLFFELTKFLAKKIQKNVFLLLFPVFLLVFFHVWRTLRLSGIAIGSRMGLHIDAADLLEGGVRIDLSRAERSMAEQGLDSAYIGSVVQHGRGKSMAEYVRRVFLERGDLAHTRAHNFI